MMNLSGLRPYFEQALPRGLDFLKQMVDVNSFTANADGVNKVGRVTAGKFAELGFTSETVPSFNPEFGEHLVLTRRGKGKRSIAMVSHLDTVFPPEEEQRNNFRWSIEGDRIYGPGTEDIKGGTMMMWLVLEALRQHSPKIFEDVTWKLFWNSSEERFSPDFGKVCCDRFESGTLGALVFEAEGMLGDQHLIVVARKGRGTFRVNVSGRASHAGGRHEHGANAVVQLGSLMPRIATLTDYSKDLTVNIGTISGGTVLNRVPHEAVAEGEFRAFSTEAYQRCKNSLFELAGPGDVRSSDDKYPCQISVELVAETRPWPRNPGSEKLYGFFEAAAEEIGTTVGPQERGGLSDGNLIWDAVPTVDGLGSWGDNDHCSERSADGSKVPEYLRLSSIVPRAVLNTIAISKLAES
jgi:glutamate carboxypeptidase